MKRILFTVNASDCDWIYQRGSGKGGQKKNKTSSAVRCIHRASRGAGYAEDTRSQSINKGLAFGRMANSKEFKAWHKLEVAKRLGIEDEVQERVDELMRDIHIRVEAKVDGKWAIVDRLENENE